MAKREVFNPPGLWPRPVRASAVRVGDLIFTAGMAGDDAKTGKVEGDIKQQTRRVFENLKILLEASGSSLKSVVKININRANVADRPLMNEVYMVLPARFQPAGAHVARRRRYRSGHPDRDRGHRGRRKLT